MGSHKDQAASEHTPRADVKRGRTVVSSQLMASSPLNWLSHSSTRPMLSVCAIITILTAQTWYLTGQPASKESR